MTASPEIFRLLPSGPPLRPFWRYYGGKFRAAPLYPKPRHETIVEPFAGAAGYACRYPDRHVVLVEKYPVVAELWRYLIAVHPSEVRRIPTNVRHVDDLPSWVPAPAKHLIGWWMNNATASPRMQLSVGREKLAEMGRNFEGWTAATRERIATQIGAIRHWKIVEGDYTSAPDVEATWFVDPPYDNAAGRHYVHDSSAIDFAQLAAWCRARRGQVMVCENEGATWLPFQPFMTFKAGLNAEGEGSSEVIWTNDKGIATPGDCDRYTGSSPRTEDES